jgi:hypothetical protein
VSAPPAAGHLAAEHAAASERLIGLLTPPRIQAPCLALSHRRRPTRHRHHHIEQPSIPPGPLHYQPTASSLELAWCSRPSPVISAVSVSQQVPLQLVDHSSPLWFFPVVPILLAAV